MNSADVKLADLELAQVRLADIELSDKCTTRSSDKWSAYGAHSLKGLECAPLHHRRKVTFLEINFHLIKREWQTRGITNYFIPQHWWTIIKETLSKTRVNSINDYPVSIYKAKRDPVRRHTHKNMTNIVQFSFWKWVHCKLTCILVYIYDVGVN